jgi:plasmid stabilization system protein ParE
MRVRLSPRAASYVRQEAAYLASHNRGAAIRFVEMIKQVREHLAQFSEAGFSETSLPIKGMRRLIRDGYRFDYRIEKAAIEIAAISSSVNTPLAVPPDDPDVDYEA